MSRYHWLTGGVDIAGAVPNSLQTTNFPLPAGATVKRFQGRNMFVGAYNEGNDHFSIRSLYMSQTVQFTSGPNSGRIIYKSTKRIPFVVSAYFAAAIPVYDGYYSAGDNELGFNQRCSYGLASGPAANLAVQWFIGQERTSYPGTYQGEVFVQFAVLYYL
ncbi:MAG TPA: hypothetical protein VHQ86_06485 [Candidatus Saccharimonadia bacterium]|jgi:hypothetical protein|nr:hypothetical protein [Candidatus Saccharimonadia bacterium]